jgi:hypothetical protein
MRKLIAIGMLVVVPACQPDPRADRDSLAQCAGNHPDDSLAIWFQRANNDGLNMPGVSVGTHPTLNCITISIQDTTDLSDVEQELRRLRIPRNAAVIAPSPVQ